MSIDTAGLLIAILGVVATLLGAGYGRAALYPPKKRLSIRVLSFGTVVAPLSDGSDVDLKIDGKSIDGGAILAAVELKSSGRADITSSDFLGKPIIGITLGRGVTHIFPPYSTDARYTKSSAKVRNGVAEVLPGLLRRNRSLIVQLLVIGPVEATDAATVFEELKDVKVVSRSFNSNSAPMRARRTAIAIGLLLIVVGSVMILPTNRDPGQPGDIYIDGVTLDPTVRLTPAETEPGANVTLDGSGLVPDETIVVAWLASTGASQDLRIKVDRNGSFAKVVVVPREVSGGTYKIVFTRNDGSNWVQNLVVQP